MYQCTLCCKLIQCFIKYLNIDWEFPSCFCFKSFTHKNLSSNLSIYSFLSVTTTLIFILWIFLGKKNVIHLKLFIYCLSTNQQNIYPGYLVSKGWTVWISFSYLGRTIPQSPCIIHWQLSAAQPSFKWIESQDHDLMCICFI